MISSSIKQLNQPPPPPPPKEQIRSTGVSSKWARVLEGSTRGGSRAVLPDGITVYYHTAAQGFTGRATGAILMLEYAGVEYICKEPSDLPPDAPSVFAVPAVRFPKSGLIVSQSAAIHQALGKALRLLPATEDGGMRALQVALNAADIVSEQSKLKENEERRNKWLDIMEGELRDAKSGFMVEQMLTYADFACYAPLKGMSLRGYLGGHPLLATWVDMMGAQPGMVSHPKCPSPPTQSTQLFDASHKPRRMWTLPSPDPTRPNRPNPTDQGV
mgnify:CR=1 FL=1